MTDKQKAVVRRFVKGALAVAATAVLTFAVQHIADYHLPPSIQGLVVATLLAGEKAVQKWDAARSQA